jgi:hypothetical protein
MSKAIKGVQNKVQKYSFTMVKKKEKGAAQQHYRFSSKAGIFSTSNTSTILSFCKTNFAAFLMLKIVSNSNIEHIKISENKSSKNIAVTTKEWSTYYNYQQPFFLHIKPSLFIFFSQQFSW